MMFNKKETPNSDVVVGDATKKSTASTQSDQPYLGAVQPHSNIKKIIIFSIFGILIIASASWLFLNREQNDEADTLATSNEGEVVDFTLKPINYEESKTGVNKDEIRVNAVENKDKVYVDNYGKALSSLEDGDNQKAITFFEQAVKASGTKSYTFYSQMALTYNALGNKKKALEYFTLAKQTYNATQAAVDDPDTRKGINAGFDQQIAESQ